MNKLDYDYMKNNIFQDFYGYDKIKEGLMLLLATDEPLNILLIGDPCSGKTFLLKRVAEASKSKIITHISELSKNKSKLVCIDNFDISFLKDDQYYGNIFSKDKSVFMTMRPEFGRFDPYELITNQIKLPKRILSEFDLIFIIKDLPSKDRDEEIVTNFLNSKNSRIEDNIIDYISSLKREDYTLTDEAKNEITKYYVNMRNIHSDDYGQTPIPITLRGIDTIIKLTKIYAKYNNSKLITKEDTKKAITLLHYILSQIGLDPETGRIDIDRIEAPESNKKSHLKHTIFQMIKQISITTQYVSLKKIIQKAERNGITKQETEEKIEELKRSGDIYEPKKGQIRMI